VRRVPALVGVGDIDQVMGNARAFCMGRLGGADLHVAVDLPRVGTDDIGAEGLSHRDRRGALAAGRRAREDEDPVGK
jgi:hypothetical protein